ncbi:hypothetical protein ACT691_20010 [Vibrio metschnikovii]
MKEGANIRGLNTALLCRCSAAIGAMIGANQWSGAVADDHYFGLPIPYYAC